MLAVNNFLTNLFSIFLPIHSLVVAPKSVYFAAGYDGSPGDPSTPVISQFKFREIGCSVVTASVVIMEITGLFLFDDFWKLLCSESICL